MFLTTNFLILNFTANRVDVTYGYYSCDWQIVTVKDDDHNIGKVLWGICVEDKSEDKPDKNSKLQYLQSYW